MLKPCGSRSMQPLEVETCGDMVEILISAIVLKGCLDSSETSKIFMGDAMIRTKSATWLDSGFL